MDSLFWSLAVGSIGLVLMSGAISVYHVRKFDRRFGKDASGKH